MNEETSFQVKFHDILGTSPETKIKYVVIPSRYRDRWVFVRHRERCTWEVPGGHIEPGESPDEAAARELQEETGAVEYRLFPVGLYSVQRGRKETYGVLYIAFIDAMGPLPQSEIAEVSFGTKLPNALTYPKIQPVLFERALAVIQQGACPTDPAGTDRRHGPMTPIDGTDR